MCVCVCERAVMDGRPVSPTEGGLDWMPSEELRSKENNPGDECRKEPPSPADISSSESWTWLSAWWRSYRRVGGLSSHHKSQIHSCFQLARLCFSFRSIHWTLLASKATRNHVTPDKASFCANSNSVLIWACISKCFSSWTINNQFLPSFFLSVLTVFPPLFLVPSSFFPSFPSLYSFVLSLSFLLSFIAFICPFFPVTFFILLSFFPSFLHSFLSSYFVTFLCCFFHCCS